jgi:hypothetical protein
MFCKIFFCVENFLEPKRALQSARFELAPPERLEPKSNALDHSAKTANNNQLSGNFVYINLNNTFNQNPM